MVDWSKVADALKPPDPIDYPEWLVGGPLHGHTRDEYPPGDGDLRQPDEFTTYAPMTVLLDGAVRQVWVLATLLTPDGCLTRRGRDEVYGLARGYRADLEQDRSWLTDPPTPDWLRGPL